MVATAFLPFSKPEAATANLGPQLPDRHLRMYALMSRSSSSVGDTDARHAPRQHRSSCQRGISRSDRCSRKHEIDSVRNKTQVEISWDKIDFLLEIRPALVATTMMPPPEIGSNRQIDSWND